MTTPRTNLQSIDGESTQAHCYDCDWWSVLTSHARAEELRLAHKC